MLRTSLRYGRISYEPEDLQLWDPTFTVPDHINKNLFQQSHNTPVTGVTIVQGIDGTFRSSVDPKLIEISRSRYEGIEIADNETLMLKTHIRNGMVSFQERDIRFRYGKWQIPHYIDVSLKEEYCSTPRGELCIISDEGQNLRCIVNIRNIDGIRTFLTKRGYIKT